jgi:hypothetical protein
MFAQTVTTPDGLGVLKSPSARTALPSSVLRRLAGGPGRLSDLTIVV